MRYAVILAGGSGTRLWPLSREDLPKQLIPALEGRSLLEEAWLRLEGAVPEDRRLVCTGERYRAAVAARIPGLTAANFVGEPYGRDTLAAISLSCALLARRDPDAVVAILTADQLMRPADTFRAALERAYSLVENDPDLLVTFGIRPTHAATGFGYIEMGDPLPGHRDGARLVSRFREKPPALEAESFLAAGPDRYLWNSGMFLWRASRFLELVARYEPKAWKAVDSAVLAAGTPAFRDRLTAEWEGIRKVSVDYGVMEPASRDPRVKIAVLGLDIEWKDIGSWPAYASLLEQDGAGNARSGRVLLSESTGTIAVSSDPGHLVACLGCEDLIVVHTPTATLVCPRSRADDVKKLQALVAEREDRQFR
jgi:mannose-1-phosphate guanylyltransferase